MSALSTPPSGNDDVSKSLPAVIPANKTQLVHLIKAGRDISPALQRPNGSQGSAGSFAELVEVVGPTNAAIAIVPMMVRDAKLLADLAGEIDESTAPSIVKMIQAFRDQNPGVSLWKWFLSQKGESPTVPIEIPAGEKTLNDIAQVTETATSNSRILFAEDEELMNHISQIAPGLARMIRSSMRSSGGSIESWLASKTPKTPEGQQVITGSSVTKVLDNSPKPDDYV